MTPSTGSNDGGPPASRRGESRASISPASEPAWSGPPSVGPRTHAILFALTGPEQGAVFPLHGTSAWLGRGPDMLVTLNDDAVSKRHAHLVKRADGSVFLEDNASRNGTYVNDELLEQPRQLLDGDHLRIGNTILRFSLLDELEERALTNLFELTVRDPLTRAYNRRYLTTHLKSELAFASRQGMSLALLLVDIDHFKRVNDSFGHAVGDVVLQLVAESIQRLLRPYDMLCRYGGEEFLVVARDTSLRNAEILAERVRRHVAQVRFDTGSSRGSVTVSIGVTVAEPRTDTWDIAALLQNADEAMYEAKGAGRNSVRVRHTLLPAPPSRSSAPPTVPPGADSESRASLEPRSQRG